MQSSRHIRPGCCCQVFGIISVTAMGCYMASSQMLPLGMFGMLSFIEPVLLFLVAVLFVGEKITVNSLLSFGPVIAGLIAYRTTAVATSERLKRLVAIRAAFYAV